MYSVTDIVMSCPPLSSHLWCITIWFHNKEHFHDLVLSPNNLNIKAYIRNDVISPTMSPPGNSMKLLKSDITLVYFQHVSGFCLFWCRCLFRFCLFFCMKSPCVRTTVHVFIHYRSACCCFMALTQPVCWDFLWVVMDSVGYSMCAERWGSDGRGQEGGRERGRKRVREWVSDLACHQKSDSIWVSNRAWVSVSVSWSDSPLFAAPARLCMCVCMCVCVSPLPDSLPSDPLLSLLMVY